MRIMFCCAVQKCILLLICFMSFLTNEWIVTEKNQEQNYVIWNTGYCINGNEAKCIVLLFLFVYVRCFTII